METQQAHFDPAEAEISKCEKGVREGACEHTGQEGLLPDTSGGALEAAMEPEAKTGLRTPIWWTVPREDILLCVLRPQFL